MSAYIRSRKHPAAQLPVLTSCAALGLALASTSAAAQSAAPVAEAASAPPQQKALPALSVKASKLQSDFKADAVSSPKFTQPLIDTPQTITVIKKELLQSQGASNLSDALSNTPGITFQLGENGNTTTGDSVFMRGFDTSGAIFVDGIRDLGTISRDTFNIEQVEVVKGPSGSDNGRGAPTGYINLSSKVASTEAFYNGSATVASGNRVRLTADLNRPLELGGIQGTAFRLNVMKDQGDKVGRDVAKNDRWGIAPSLALGLGTSTRAYINFLHVVQDNVPDGGIPAIGYPGYTNSLLGITSGSKVDTSNFYGSKNQDYDHVRADMFTVRIEHDLAPGTTIRNTSRWGRTEQQYVLTGVNTLTIPSLSNPAGWTVSRSHQGKDQENEILTNQTNLTTSFNTGEFKHTLSTGFEFIYEKQSNVGFTSGSGTANLYDPVASDYALPTESGAFTKGNTTTAAIYAFDTLELSRQWQINGGLRFEKYSTEYLSIPATTATPQTATNLEKSGQLLSWKLSGIYKPQDNGSIYVTYATSQKPPGSDNFTLNAPPTTGNTSNINNPNLEPQKATNFEVGTKWDLLENRLVVTGAAFNTINRNDQADRDPATGEITQYGKKRVRGIELGASGQVTPELQLSTGLAWINTKVVAGSNTSTAPQSGAAINFSPKLTFTSWVTYKLPAGFTVGGGARYVASQVSQINSNQASVTGLPRIPSYWVFDAMAGYEISKNISLQLNVKNIADKDYIASVNNGRSRYTLGAPRTIQLTADFRY